MTSKRIEMVELNSLSNLAGLLEISEFTLARLCREVDHLYRRHHQRKRGGGQRVLMIPSAELKEVQRRLLKNYLCELPLSDSCMGFRKGRSIRTNAEQHAGSRFVFNTDLKDFFPSISPERVFYLFVNNGATDRVAYLLSRLTTYNNQLPQGAPTSPVVANLVATSMDHRLMAFALTRDWTYTRYCDDITISGDTRFSFSDSIRMREIIESEGFELNEKKTRLLLKNSPQVVTGLVVNEKPNLPRKLRHNLRAMFFNASKDPDTFRKNRKQLEDYLAYLTMVDPRGKVVSEFRDKFNLLVAQN